MSDTDLLIALMGARAGHDEGEAILNLLRGAQGPDLDQMLRAVNGPELFRSVDSGQRSELTDLLGRQRHNELSVQARARVVHGLQSMRRTTQRDQVLVEILLAHRAAELTRLKNLINTAEDHQDLEDLIYADLHEHDRQTVLVHIASEAQGVTVGEPKVLSDIDDTVFCKLNDRRWPRGMIYPGILALFEALDLGPDEQPFDRGDLTFVTARPADAWGLVENLSRAALRQAGVSRLSVLSGSLRALVSKEAMAARKLENIDHYRALFPEYRLVFVGDSGQGDVLVGERLVNADTNPAQLVLIHDVVGTPPETRRVFASRGIHFVDTYIGAAVTAYEHGLISLAGVVRAANEAVGGFERTRWDSTDQRDRMRDLFEQDLARVDALAESNA